MTDRAADERPADDDLVRRAKIHAALGEPVRLSIVDELTTSDRSPKELADRLGLASNLLAHHLDVLQSVGLVERFVSSGDARRRYVRLVRTPLDTLALRTPPAIGPNDTVLFVCSHNSARSQLAAALWRTRTGTSATSAGTHPADRVHPGAVAAAERVGLDLAGVTPRRLEPGESADIVVTVCDQAHEELEPEPWWLHWSIPDPVAAGTAQAFDDALHGLDARIATWAPSDDLVTDHTTSNRSMG